MIDCPPVNGPPKSTGVTQIRNVRTDRCDSEHSFVGGIRMDIDIQCALDSSN